MLCPVCQVPLLVVERDGIEVDYCLACRGLWFDSGEVELLAEKLELEAPLLSGPVIESDEKPRRCPRCDLRMKKIQVAGLDMVADGCPNGEGLWLDRGELRTVLSRSTAGSTEGTSAVVSFLGEVFGRTP